MLMPRLSSVVHTAFLCLCLCVCLRGKWWPALKMKVLKLKKWNLLHQYDNMGIGLPSVHDTDEENS